MPRVKVICVPAQFLACLTGLSRRASAALPDFDVTRFAPQFTCGSGVVGLRGMRCGSNVSRKFYSNYSVATVLFPVRSAWIYMTRRAQGNVLRDILPTAGWFDIHWIRIPARQYGFTAVAQRHPRHGELVSSRGKVPLCSVPVLPQSLVDGNDAELSAIKQATHFRNPCTVRAKWMLLFI